MLLQHHHEASDSLNIMATQTHRQGSVYSRTTSEPVMEPSTALAQKCRGINVPWAAGPIYTTFPFTLVDSERHELGFHIEVKNKGSELWVQSMSCLGFEDRPGVPCSACSGIPGSRKFANIKARAAQPWHEHTEYKYQNMNQCMQELRRRGQVITGLGKEVCPSAVFPGAVS